MRKYFYVAMIGMMAALLWQCAGERSEPLSSEMRKEISLLPVSGDKEYTPGLAYINFAKIRQSPFYEMMLDSMKQHMRPDREFEDFVAATGFDLRKDVNEAYIIFEPAPRKKEAEFLVVAIGKYNPEKIMQYVSLKDSSHHLTQESYRDFVLYQLEKKDKALCFANDSYAIVGSEPLVKRWLDNSKSGGNSGDMNGALIDQVKPVKYKTGAWLTLNTGGMMEHMMDEIARHAEARRFDALRAVKHINFSMNIDNDIHLNGSGIFSDAEKAKLFHDAVKGALAAWKLSLSGDREAVDVVNKVKVETGDSQVRVSCEMSREDIEKLMKRHRGLAMRW